jgi:succinate dehydrogenase / fumarate reductase membrane anchor subunit
MVRRDRGASRTGLGAWWWQRVSAVYIGVCLLGGLGWLLLDPPAGFGAWVARLRWGPVPPALAVLVLAVAVHAYVGVRDIFMDYLPAGTVRVAALGAWTALLTVGAAAGLLWVAGLQGG